MWYNICIMKILLFEVHPHIVKSHRGRDHMVVGFTTTCAISAYHHKRSELESCSWQSVLDTTLCDKVCY